MIVSSLLIHTPGKGSFARMKNIMHDEVSANQATMFSNATQGIWNQLETMCKQCRTTMRGRVQRLYQTIARDYLAVIGSEISKDSASGKLEKIARRTVDDVIAKSEAVFGEVLDCNLDLLEKAEITDVRGRVVDVGSEGDVEDATQPLIVLSDDDVDEDSGMELSQ
jgi:hypothetical protein